MAKYESTEQFLRDNPEFAPIFSGEYLTGQRIGNINLTKNEVQRRAISAAAKAGVKMNNVHKLIGDINSQLRSLGYAPSFLKDPHTGEMVVEYYPINDPNYFKDNPKEKAPQIRISLDENGVIVNNGIRSANLLKPIIDPTSNKLALVTELEASLMEIKKSLNYVGNQNKIRAGGQQGTARLGSVLRRARSTAMSSSSVVNTSTVNKTSKAPIKITKNRSVNNAVTSVMDTESLWKEFYKNFDSLHKHGLSSNERNRHQDNIVNSLKKASLLFTHVINEKDLYSGDPQRQKRAIESAWKQIEASFPEITSLKNVDKATRNAIKNIFIDFAYMGIEEGIVSDTNALDRMGLVNVERAMSDALFAHGSNRKLRAVNDIRTRAKNNSRKGALTIGSIFGTQAEKALKQNFKDANRDLYGTGSITQSQYNAAFAKFKAKHLKAGMTEQAFEKKYGHLANKSIIEDAMLVDKALMQNFDAIEHERRHLSKEQIDKIIKEKYGENITQAQKEEYIKKEIAKELSLNLKKDKITDLSIVSKNGKEQYYVEYDKQYKMQTGSKIGLSTGSTRAVVNSIDNRELFEMVLKEAGYNSEQIKNIGVITERPDVIEAKKAYELMVGYMQGLYVRYYQGKNEEYCAALNNAAGVKDLFYIDKDTGQIMVNPEKQNILYEQYDKFLTNLGAIEKNNNGSNPFSMENGFHVVGPVFQAHEVNQLAIAKYGAASYKGGHVHYGYREQSALKRLHGEMRGSGLKTDKLDTYAQKLLDNNTQITQEEYQKRFKNFEHVRDQSLSNISSSNIEKIFGKEMDASLFTEEQLQKIDYLEDGTISEEEYNKSLYAAIDKAKHDKYEELLQAGYTKEQLKAAGIHSEEDVPIFINVPEYQVQVRNKNGDLETVTSNKIRVGNYHAKKNEEGNYTIDNYAAGIKSIINKSQDLNNQDVISEWDRIGLGDIVNNYLLDYEGTFKTHGANYKQALVASIGGSMQPTTVAGNPKFFEKTGLKNTVLISKNDAFNLLNKTKGEDDDAYISRLNAIYKDIYGRGYTFSKKDKRRLSPEKKAELIKQQIIKAATYGSKNYTATGGKGLISFLHRYPSSNGKDMHYVKVLVDPTLSDGTVSGDPSLMKLMNADYDGDHGILTLFFSDGTIVQEWDEEQKGEALAQARAAQVHEIKRVENLSKRISAGSKDQSKEIEKIKKLNSSKEETFLQKYNKEFTGVFSNAYQGVERLLYIAGLDETGVEEGNAESKKRAIQSAITRAFLEAPTQESISAKKATLSQKADSNWWRGLEELNQLIIDPNNWKDEKGILRVIDKMQELGILDEDGENLLKDRISAQLPEGAPENISKKDIVDSILGLNAELKNRKVVGSALGSKGVAISSIGDALSYLGRYSLITGSGAPRGAEGFKLAQNNNGAISLVPELGPLGDVLISIKDELSRLNSNLQGNGNLSVGSLVTGKKGVIIPSTEFSSMSVSSALNLMTGNGYKNLEPFQNNLLSKFGELGRKVEASDLDMDIGVFNGFVKEMLYPLKGKVADAFEQGIQEASKLGYDVSEITSPEQLLGINDQKLSAILNSSGKNKKGKVVGSEGIGFLKKSIEPILRALYGDDWEKVWLYFTELGKAQRINAQNLGGSILGEEQGLAYMVNDRLQEHGRADIVTKDYQKTLLGDEKHNVLRIWDKKITDSTQPSERYMLQVLKYVNSLRDAQKFIQENNIGSFKEFKGSDYYKNLKDLNINSSIFKELKNGALIAPALAFTDSKGRNSQWDVGAGFYSNGSLKITGNYDWDKILWGYIENNVPIEKWDPVILERFKESAKRRTDAKANINFGIGNKNIEDALKVGSEEELNKVVKAYTEIAKIEQDIYKNELKINKLRKENNPEAIALANQLKNQNQGLKAQTEELKNNLRNSGVNIDNPDPAIRKIISDYNRKNALFKAELDYKNKNNNPGFFFKPMEDSIVNWGKRLLQGGLFTKLVSTVRRGLNDLIRKSKELDQALTNLRIVSGLSREDTTRLMNEYSKLGKEIGATTKEITTSATEWIRQGYNMAEVNDLVKASMYLSKLGMIDSATATRDLTSAMKGFKLEASEAMSIVDKLTSLDLKAATTAGDIAQGLAQFANVANINGVDLDQASAFVATIADVTQQSGSSVGTALRTIISRFSNVKAGKFNNLDLNSISGDESEKLNDVEIVLNKLGISIRDTNLQFKEFDEVLGEIAAKWDSLDSVSKKAIATAFAGTRQQEYFLTLMENYDKYEELLDTSRNSKGTAEKKYESYSESYQASLNRLTNAIENLANNAQVAHFMQQFVDFATWMVEKAGPFLLEWIPRAVTMVQGFKILTGNPNNILMRLGGYFKESFGSNNGGKKGFLSALFGTNGKNNQQLVEAKTQTAEEKKQTAETQKQTVESQKQTAEAQKQTAEIKKQTLESQKQTAEAQKQTSKATVTATRTTTSSVPNIPVNGKAGAAAGAAQGAEGAVAGAEGAETAAAGSSGAAATGIAFAVAYIINQIMAGISTYATANPTHTSLSGETVESSKEAFEAGRNIETAAALIIPILGPAIGAAISESIARRIDSEKDSAEALSKEANEMLSALNSISSDVTTMSNKIGTQDAVTAAKDFISTIYKKENKEMRKLLQKYLSNGSGETIYEVVEKIKAGDEAAARALQIAELQAEESQIVNSYARDSYDLEQVSSENVMKALNFSGRDQAEAIATGKTWGIATEVVGTIINTIIGAIAGAAIAAAGEAAAEVVTEGGATPAVVATTPAAVSGGAKIGALVGALAGQIISIPAALLVDDAARNIKGEELEKEFERTWNEKSSEEKLESLNEMADEIRLNIEKGIEPPKVTTDFFGWFKKESKSWEQQLEDIESAISAQKELNANNRMIVEQLNDKRMEAAIIGAMVGNTPLTNLSENQLQNIGYDVIYKSVIQALDDQTNGQGLFGVNIYQKDEEGNLVVNEYGKELIKEMLINNSPVMSSFFSDSGRTLSEVLALSKTDAYKDSDEIKDVLNNFAQALNVSIEDLANLEDKYGSLRYSDFLKSSEEIQKTTNNINTLITSLMNGASSFSEWMNDVIAKYPRFAPYMNDTAKFIEEVIKLNGDYLNLGIESQYNELSNSDEVWKEMKPNIYSQLSKETIEELDKNNISNFSDLTNFLSYQYNEDGTLNSVGQEVLDAFAKMYPNFELTSSIGKQQLDMLIDYQNKKLDNEIDNLNSQKQALQDINSQREYELKLIEAKLKLEDASKEKKRVYRAGVGWVYEADQSSIEQAQKELDSLENQKTISELDSEILDKTKEKERLNSEENNLQYLDKFYNSWIEELKENGIIGQGFNNLSTLVGQIKNGITVNVIDKINADADNENEQRNTALKELGNAWQTLQDVMGNPDATPEDRETAWNTYQTKYKEQVANGNLSQKDIESQNWNSIHVNGEDYNAYAAGSTNPLAMASAEERYFVKGPGLFEPFDQSKYNPFTIGGALKALFTTWSSRAQQEDYGRIFTKGEKVNPSNLSWDLISDIFGTGMGTGLMYWPIEGGNKIGSGRWLSGLQTPDDPEDLSAGIYYSPNWLWGGSTGSWVISDGAGNLNKLGFVANTKNLDHANGVYTAGEVRGWASGTLSTNNDSVSMINEFGTEAIVTPSGTITALPSHTGVVPADVTKNLWQLGEVAPSIMRTLEAHLGNINMKTNMLGGTDESFNVGTINMTVNADNTFDADAFVESVKARASLTRNTNR